MVAYGGRDDGLFHGVISESNFFPSQPYLSELEYQFNRTVALNGCGDADSKMDCLRGRSMAELQATNVPSPFPGRTSTPQFYWTPCVDGELLENPPYTLYEAGNVVDVPVLAGSCTNGRLDEASLTGIKLTGCRGIVIHSQEHRFTRRDDLVPPRQLPRTYIATTQTN